MEPAGSTFFWALAALVLAAPLYRGGNRALPLVALELVAIGLLLALAFRRIHGHAASPRPRTLTAAIAILLVWPLVQLVPLPMSVWQALPGHAPYADVLGRFAVEGAALAPRAISIDPSSTEYGWLALLPPLAALVAVRSLASAQVVWLLTAMAVGAGLQGVLGLLQVIGGASSPLNFGNAHGGGMATGTFVNRNHLAALLAMTLPVIVGLVVYGVRRGRHEAARGRAGDANALAQRALLFASAIVVLLGLVFTASRAGIATALVGLAMTALLLVPGRGSVRRARWTVVALVLTGFALAAGIGLAPVLDRFAPDALELSGDGRFALYAATLGAAVDFLPFGSGLSTFATVFPRYQAGAFGGYVDFAHNDYLQAFLELGIAGALVAALLVAAWISGMASLLRRSSGRSFTLLQLAAGVGMLPLALHSVFDFSLHMPGNAVWFAALFGVLLHPGVPEAERARTSRSGREDEVAGAAT